jgi:hypothetical protein
VPSASKPSGPGQSTGSSSGGSGGG